MYLLTHGDGVAVSNGESKESQRKGRNENEHCIEERYKPVEDRKKKIDIDNIKCNIHEWKASIEKGLEIYIDLRNNIECAYNGSGKSGYTRSKDCKQSKRRAKPLNNNGHGTAN